LRSDRSYVDICPGYRNFNEVLTEDMSHSGTIWMKSCDDPSMLSIIQFEQSVSEKTTTYVKPAFAEALTSALALTAYIEMCVTVLVIVTLKVVGIIQDTDGGGMVGVLRASTSEALQQAVKDVGEENADAGAVLTEMSDMKANVSKQMAKIKKDAEAANSNVFMMQAELASLRKELGLKASPNQLVQRTSTVDNDFENLPPGWVKKESRSKPGKFFYYNVKSGASQADLPV